MKIPENLDDIVARGDDCSLPPPDKEEIATVLFLAYRHYLKSIALRYVPMPHLADDVVQQVFTKLIAEADSFDLNRNPKALLAVMTQNQAKHLWREESRHFPPNLQKLAERISIWSNEETEDEKYADQLDALQHCLDKTSDKIRTLIRLYYFGQVPVREIGDRMNMSVEAVYKAIFRIREKLRECILRLENGGTTYV